MVGFKSSLSRWKFCARTIEVETTSRTNLSLHISTDNGENWKYLKTIWSGPSAYSSLTTY